MKLKNVTNKITAATRFALAEDSFAQQVRPKRRKQDYVIRTAAYERRTRNFNIRRKNSRRPMPPPWCSFVRAQRRNAKLPDDRDGGAALDDVNTQPVVGVGVPNISGALCRNLF